MFAFVDTSIFPSLRSFSSTSTRRRSHLVQTFKGIHIEHGFAVRAVKAFDKAVLHWLAGLYEFELDAVLFGPFGDRDGREFGAIIEI